MTRITEDEAARVRALAGIAGVYKDEALLWKHVETPGLESGESQAGQVYQRAREEYRRAREEAERRRQDTKIER